MTNTKVDSKAQLIAEATKLLAKAGYRWDGRRLGGGKSESIRAISTPCGGQPKKR